MLLILPHLTFTPPNTVTLSRLHHMNVLTKITNGGFMLHFVDISQSSSYSIPQHYLTSMDYFFLVPIISFSCLTNNVFQKLTHSSPLAKGSPSPIFVNKSYWSTMKLIYLFICLWLPLELNSWDKYLITELKYLVSYLLQKNFVNLCYIIGHFSIK